MNQSIYSGISLHVRDITELAYLAIIDRMAATTGRIPPVEPGELSKATVYFKKLITITVQVTLGDEYNSNTARIHNLETILTFEDIDLIKRVARFAILSGDFKTRISETLLNRDNGNSF